ncbi:MAG: Ig-like domain-containing protein [Christensenellaceae bacterium]|nr:Ig-like domain-containing protein [Christensenellaceae bacterium]
MKKIISIVLCICFIMVIMPVAASGSMDTSSKLINTGALEIDDDGSDGYSGDYVVIYNPGTSAYSGSASTGNMSGLIETEIDFDFTASEGANKHSDRPYTIDIDSVLAEEAERNGITAEGSSEKTLSFEVGDTHYFNLYASYCPLPNTRVEFEVLAKGEHCYIWTPTSTASNVYPLDEIDESFADICAAEFDSKFDLMQSSFGDHTNGSQGDGRLNILYYNIDCGWQPGDGYVAGFFTGADISSNGMPCLNIDTYPGVYYVNTQGEEIIDVTSTYNTMVHEYQHLINYSVCGYSDSWINECMSAAAEEICYPGSSVAPRIQSWLNYKFSENEDWLNPPAEHEYNPYWELHNGFSMYDWSDWLDMSDRLALYAQVSLYAQYIYTQYGNPTFRALLERMAAGQGFTSAFQTVTGQNASEFTRNFRIALTANTPDQYDGIYGFRMQEGYDPEQYYGVENLYNWLAPLVFTGNSCSIAGGGAITVKPVDGVYYPPQGASSSLEYYGITLNSEPPEPVALTSISLNPGSIEIYEGGSARINAVREPQNANNFELTWTSSNPSVAAVNGNNRNATITGVEPGTAIITVNAHDNINNRDYSASAQVFVKHTPSLNEALNVENGTLEFNGSASNFPFEVDTTSDEGRASVRSTNAGVHNSESYFTLTVNMNAGDAMSFDWRTSSEQNYDKLEFYVNDAYVQGISGETSWATVSYTATTTGSFTFRWSYSKDGSVDRGSDCGWVDNVFVPGYVGGGSDYELGDVDMDGSITVSDALLALRCAMQITALTSDQLALADVDNSGIVDGTDALIILRRAMNIA